MASHATRLAFGSTRARKALEKMRDFYHGPSILPAVDKESLAELGFTLRCGLRVKSGIQIGYLGSGTVGDFVQGAVIEIGSDCRKDRLD